MAEVRGTVEPGFEQVRDAFQDNFDSHGEVGAAFSLYVDGKAVVNLHRHHPRPRPTLRHNLPLKQSNRAYSRP